MGTIKEAALRYAQHGLCVLPCAGKVPLPDHAYQDATTNADKITRWWKRYPEANVRLVPGSANYLVVDVDIKGDVDGHASVKALEAEHGPLPETRTVVTPSGGVHLYFGIPEGETFGNRPPAAGVDVRCHKGFCVAPPSSIEGVPYRWSNRLNVEPLPDKWVELLREKPYVAPADVGYSIINPTIRHSRDNANRATRAYVVAALEDERDKLLHAPEGCRHPQLTRYAFSLGQLVDQGLLESDIEASAEWVFGQWSWSKVRPNFKNARRTLRECLTAGMAKPRGAK